MLFQEKDKLILSKKAIAQGNAFEESGIWSGLANFKYMKTEDYITNLPWNQIDILTDQYSDRSIFREF